MKTVQERRSVGMEHVVNHAWAKPLVDMNQASILKVVISLEYRRFWHLSLHITYL